MSDHYNTFSLKHFAGLIADCMSISLPKSYAPGIPWISNILHERLGGTADRAILYHADEACDPQYFRCRASGEVIGPYGGIRYLGDLYKDGYYHVLICLGKRRKGKIADTVRIRSEKFIQTEVSVKICGYGAPPVESKVIE